MRLACNVSFAVVFRTHAYHAMLIRHDLFVNGVTRSPFIHLVFHGFGLVEHVDLPFDGFQIHRYFRSPALVTHMVPIMIYRSTKYTYVLFALVTVFVFVEHVFRATHNVRATLQRYLALNLGYRIAQLSGFHMTRIYLFLHSTHHLLVFYILLSIG